MRAETQAKIEETVIYLCNSLLKSLKQNEENGGNILNLSPDDLIESIAKLAETVKDK